MLIDSWRTVDKLGHIYVVDRGNDRIQKFDSNGKFITAWGSHGINNGGQFSEVADVTVDSTGHVYVSDYGDNTVKVFGLDAKIG
jgi:DNA-binding beta-propeller fold protein YncE